MSESVQKPDTQEAERDQTPDINVLERKLEALFARHEQATRIPLYEPRARVVPKREPMFSPRIIAAIKQTFAFWPLLIVNAVLLWISMRVFNDGDAALYVGRIVRIVQLCSVALVFDVWLHPMQHPDTLEGPAQGARQYQRIYLIGIFVLAGCIAL